MSVFGIPHDVLKDLGLVGAIATVISAIVTGLISIFFKMLADKNIEKLKAELSYEGNKNIEKLKADLAYEGKIKTARIDYEYEAQKRLYKEVEPILFAAHLAATSLSDRLEALAPRICDGYICCEPTKNWLTTDLYFQQSTAYWIFLPMTYYRHLSGRISQFDMTLVPEIGKKFMTLGLFRSIPVADFELARSPIAAIPYDPYGEATKAQREADPAQYKFQGIVRGDVERFVSLMMTAEGTPLEWFQFEQKLREADSDLTQAYEPVRDVLVDFHPSTHPVMWRTIIAYALLSDFFIQAREFTSEEYDSLIPQDSWRRFDYRMRSETSDEVIPRQHFEVARIYLRSKLTDRFKTFSLATPTSQR
jgi:hypothetical protein